MNNKTVKINFHVKTGDDGDPPVAVESLWAERTKEGYLIDSVPFFTNEATNGDRVAVSSGEGDARWFDKILQRSGNSLIRVVFFDLDRQDAVVNHLILLGCGTERMSHPGRS